MLNAEYSNVYKTLNYKIRTYNNSKCINRNQISAQTLGQSIQVYVLFLSIYGQNVETPFFYPKNTVCHEHKLHIQKSKVNHSYKIAPNIAVFES